MTREEAIDILKRNYPSSCFEDLCNAVDIAIQALSTEQGKKDAQQWIPCSTKLPSPRQSVIISTNEWTGEGCYWETTEHHVIWKGYRWNATYWDDEVTAWMPLPESFQRTQHVGNTLDALGKGEEE